MKTRKIILYTAFAVILFITSSSCVFYFKSPEVFRCSLINFSSEFNEYNNNIYISKDTPAAVRDSLLVIILKSGERVCKFWNVKERTGKPSVIYCNTKSLLHEYSGGRAILTYKSYLGSYIVLGRECINEDMVSHELQHAELYSRTGYFNNSKIPAWFDEGIAMQVDYREAYSEKRFCQMKDSMKSEDAISQISNQESFMRGNYYYHYLLAKHETAKWLNEAKKEGLINLIARLNNGEDFYLIYNELKIKKPSVLSAEKIAFNY